MTTPSRSRVLLPALLLLGLFSLPAQADFFVLDDPSAEPVVYNSPPPSPALPMGGVQYVGEGNQAWPVKGYGSNMPLKAAIQAIAPAGWRGLAARGMNVDLPVNWRGDRDWRDILTDLARDYRLQITVDWAQRRVLLSPQADRPAPALPVAPTAGQAPAAPTGVTGQLLFQAKAGYLSDSLTAFLRANQWDLVWKAGSDFQISTPFALEGENIPTLMARVAGQYRLNARVYTQNRVVVFEDAGQSPLQP